MTLLNHLIRTLEPGPTSIFPNFVGEASVDVVELLVDGGSAEFVVGETVTGGTSGATGVILEIRDLAGVWDGVTSSGTATLVLGSVTDAFDEDGEDITGDADGVAVADGTGTVTTLPVDPTSVMGKGVESVLASTTLGEDGLYTITLSTQFAGLLAVKSCVIDTTSADDWEVLVVSETVATTRQIVIQTLKGGAVAELTDDEKLCLEVVLATSSMKPVSY